MRWVGGHESYLLLRADSRAYEDVLIAMAGHARANKLNKRRAR